MKETNKTKYKADQWFADGNRISYNLENKKITESIVDSSLKIWSKVINNNQESHLTMMPGFPDGSFGWAATEEHLSTVNNSERLYIEYIGMGDSDKPDKYIYSVYERADMIEALWQYHNVKSTSLITFDFSSLVALELLSRQIERINAGEILETTIKNLLTINGGLFSDSHTHPLLTTPLLKTPIGKMGTKIAQNSQFAFNLMMKDLWSKEYKVSKEELVENFNAITRRNGAIFMSNAARFVDEHKENNKRWDFKRIFLNTYPNIKYIVAGSEQDQFEYKQVQKAKYQLEHLGLKIKMFPGGHMTTSEQPHLIANTIAELTFMD
tara:strand:+ start:136818 stop:137789 length:972 start_codon:yes stop_codon:yes gene_type:complete